MTLDKNLKKNASGYYDETPYKALTKGPKPGEIWINSGTGKRVLIVAANEQVYSCLRLEEGEGKGRIPVAGKNLLYTNPAMMCYAFGTALAEFERSLPIEQFKAIRDKVASALGFQAEGGETPDMRALDERAKTLADEVDTLKDERDELISDLGKMSAYKDMYNHLLDRLIAAKAL